MAAAKSGYAVPALTRCTAAADVLNQYTLPYSSPQVSQLSSVIAQTLLPAGYRPAQATFR